jgi:hypothetical protein
VTQHVTPKAIWNADDRRASYQYRLLARGVPIFWWSDVLFRDDPKLFAATQHCGARGVFVGEQDLTFAPNEAFVSEDQHIIDERLGTNLPWPPGAMTRGEAAVFICTQMGWPIE